jgi:hypothetical protein
MIELVPQSRNAGQGKHIFAWHQIDTNNILFVNAV